MVPRTVAHEELENLMQWSLGLATYQSGQAVGYYQSNLSGFLYFIF
jgi:hypothetical protein